MSGPQNSARVALYFAPPADSQLWRLGSEWLGRDAATGAEVPQPASAELGSADLFELTRTARIYGFHYTLKAPFALADGCGLDAIETAAADFVRTRAPFEMPALTVGQHHGFPALLLSVRSASMEALARDVVMEFDAFRAPSTPEDDARRRGAGLTDRQEGQLKRWGYPFIFEDARFHMTLGPKLPEADAAPYLASLRAHFAPVLGKPIRAEGIALFTRDTPERPFRIRRYFPFTPK